VALGGVLERFFDVVVFEDNIPAVEALCAPVDEDISRLQFFFRRYRSDQVGATTTLDTDDFWGRFHVFTLPSKDTPG
jgi:hypothetical protein